MYYFILAYAFIFASQLVALAPASNLRRISPSYSLYQSLQNNDANNNPYHYSDYWEQRFDQAETVKDYQSILTDMKFWLSWPNEPQSHQMINQESREALQTAIRAIDALSDFLNNPQQHISSSEQWQTLKLHTTFLNHARQQLYIYGTPIRHKLGGVSALTIEFNQISTLAHRFIDLDTLQSSPVFAETLGISANDFDATQSLHSFRDKGGRIQFLSKDHPEKLSTYGSETTFLTLDMTGSVSSQIAYSLLRQHLPKEAVLKEPFNATSTARFDAMNNISPYGTIIVPTRLDASSMSKAKETLALAQLNIPDSIPFYTIESTADLESYFKIPEGNIVVFAEYKAIPNVLQELAKQNISGWEQRTVIFPMTASSQDTGSALRLAQDFRHKFQLAAPLALPSLTPQADGQQSRIKDKETDAYWQTPILFSSSTSTNSKQELPFQSISGEKLRCGYHSFMYGLREALSKGWSFSDGQWNTLQRLMNDVSIQHLFKSVPHTSKADFVKWLEPDNGDPMSSIKRNQMFALLRLLLWELLDKSQNKQAFVDAHLVGALPYDQWMTGNQLPLLSDFFDLGLAVRTNNDASSGHSWTLLNHQKPYRDHDYVITMYNPNAGHYDYLRNPYTSMAQMKQHVLSEISTNNDQQRWLRLAWLADMTQWLNRFVRDRTNATHYRELWQQWQNLKQRMDQQGFTPSVPVALLSNDHDILYHEVQDFLNHNRHVQALLKSDSVVNANNLLTEFHQAKQNFESISLVTIAQPKPHRPRGPLSVWTIQEKGCQPIYIQFPATHTRQQVVAELKEFGLIENNVKLKTGATFQPQTLTIGSTHLTSLFKEMTSA